MRTLYAVKAGRSRRLTGSRRCRQSIHRRGMALHHQKLDAHALLRCTNIDRNVHTSPLSPNTSSSISSSEPQPDIQNSPFFRPTCEI